MKTRDKAIGAGIGMAALAAAGAYFLYGRKGNGSRDRIAGWALQLKGEVLEKMEKFKSLDRKAYVKLVDETTARYGRVKRVSASELKGISTDLKKAWTHIGKQLA